MTIKRPEVEDHACCYADCPHEGVFHIGPNGGDSHWICFRHLERWNKNRARFLTDGGGCEMAELGELLTDAPSAVQPTGCLPTDVFEVKDE